mmetsp:Transcript_18865/g.43867  ORF Transcript_18865/g.43867 Transcript_18865/m.43867 type:complete len:234 (-) Transcript_18865:40-741(-)
MISLDLQLNVGIHDKNIQNGYHDWKTTERLEDIPPTMFRLGFLIFSFFFGLLLLGQRIVIHFGDGFIQEETDNEETREIHQHEDQSHHIPFVDLQSEPIPIHLGQPDIDGGSNGHAQDTHHTECRVDLGLFLVRDDLGHVGVGNGGTRGPYATRESSDEDRAHSTPLPEGGGRKVQYAAENGRRRAEKVGDPETVCVTPVSQARFGQEGSEGEGTHDETVHFLVATHLQDVKY